MKIINDYNTDAFQLSNRELSEKFSVEKPQSYETLTIKDSIIDRRFMELKGIKNNPTGISSNEDISKAVWECFESSFLR